MLNKIGSSIEDMIPDPKFDLKTHNVEHIKKIIMNKMSTTNFKLKMGTHLSLVIIKTNSEKWKLINVGRKEYVPQEEIYIRSKYFNEIIYLISPLLTPYFIVTFIEILDDVLPNIEGSVEFV